MKITTVAAIYFLLWFLSLFMILPFEAHAKGDVNAEAVPGQADSAPAHFSLKRVLLRTSLLAAGLFFLADLNYRFGWVTLESFNRLFNWLFNPPN